MCSTDNVSHFIYMNKIVFSNRLNWPSLLFRAIVSLVGIFLFIVLVAILQGQCHLSTLLIFAAFVIVLNVISAIFQKRNNYSIQDDKLIIEEHFPLRKQVRIVVPISYISDCYTGRYLYKFRVYIDVAGSIYYMSEISNSQEIVELIINKNHNQHE